MANISPTIKNDLEREEYALYQMRAAIDALTVLEEASERQGVREVAADYAMILLALRSTGR